MQMRRYKNTAIVAVFFLLLLVGIAFAVPSFRTLENFSNILVQFVPLALLSMGQTFVIISGGVDMSVGVVMSATTVVLATRMPDSAGGILAGVALVALMGALMGLVNGLSVAVCKMPPIIVTISTSTVLQGVAFTFLKEPGGSIPPSFEAFFTHRFGFLSASFLCMAVTCLLLRAVLKSTSFGTHLYAVGNNPQIAVSAGVKARKTVVFAYLISSLVAVLAGIVMACRLRSGDPVIGTPYALDSITASIIGGASLSGGEGFALGAVFGAFVLGILSNVMNSIGISSYYQYVFKGLLFILTMAMYTMIGRLEKKRNAF